jgi:hypothetical protein
MPGSKVGPVASDASGKKNDSMQDPSQVGQFEPNILLVVVSGRRSPDHLPVSISAKHYAVQLPLQTVQVDPMH